MACARCRTRWRGVLPILGLLAMIGTAGVVAYQFGRYHQQPANWSAQPQVRVIVVDPSVPVEPNHNGHR